MMGELYDVPPPSSAGECMVCGKDVPKRYGGMGRYLAMCIDCWLRGE